MIFTATLGAPFLRPFDKLTAQDKLGGWKLLVLAFLTFNVFILEIVLEASRHVYENENPAPVWNRLLPHHRHAAS